jgi:hypothetical protein
LPDTVLRELLTGSEGKILEKFLLAARFFVEFARRVGILNVVCD